MILKFNIQSVNQCADILIEIMNKIYNHYDRLQKISKNVEKIPLVQSLITSKHSFKTI